MIDQNLRQRLGPERHRHVHSVKILAVKLAERYGEKTEHAAVAALLHDYVKWMSTQELMDTASKCGLTIAPLDLGYPQILHAIVGAEVARVEFDIREERILSAIRLHTTGDAGMGTLDKILYVADYAEPHRTHALATPVRETALSGALDQACLQAVDGSIANLLRKRARIHPRTVAAHNDLIAQLKEDKRR